MRPMLIVSFTTVPPRFRFLPRFLAALERQDLRPDRVELNLPAVFRRFPGARPALPPLPDWLRVVEVGADLGPATKVLPALRRWHGQDVRIVYCDDDKAYDPGWLARLAAAADRLPGRILGERGCHIGDIGRFDRAPGAAPQPRAIRAPAYGKTVRRMWQDPAFRPETSLVPAFAAEGHVDILFGAGGVLARPDDFHPDAFEDPGPLWPVDDIWLSGMAAARGTPAWVTAGPIPLAPLDAADRTAPLFLAEQDGLARRELDWLGVAWFRDTYGVWP